MDQYIVIGLLPKNNVYTDEVVIGIYLSKDEAESLVLTRGRDYEATIVAKIIS